MIVNRTFAAAGLIAAAVLLGGCAAGAAETFEFHHPDVLGTSMDLVVVAPDEAAAQAADRAALAEVERLRKILSTYDDTSEISRLAGAAGPVKVSPDLAAVLDACEQWRTRSGGAFNAGVADLTALWTKAAAADRLPDAASLAAAVARLGRPAYRVDKAAGTVTVTPGRAINVDALAKGYIVDKAFDAARAAAPALAGLLVDIGGDLRCWGTSGAGAAEPWVIGIADPRHPAENAPLLARVRIAAGAVATSGHYARQFKIGGKAYSHILDPRTGQPVSAVMGATVIAPDCATADALATALCVLPPADGLRLAKATPRAEALVLDSAARPATTDNWAALVAPETARLTGMAGAPGLAPKAPAQAAAGTSAQAASGGDGGAWPAGFQLSVGITLAPARHRPYVAIWIESPDGRLVRTLDVWGRERKYQQKLPAWWPLVRDNPDRVKAVTRASRGAGTYAVAWDGRDDAGNPLPQGRYVLRIEAAQEKGAVSQIKAPVDCGGQAASGRVEGNATVSAVALTYGPATP